MSAPQKIYSNSRTCQGHIYTSATYPATSLPLKIAAIVKYKTLETAFEKPNTYVWP